ncbi:MAG: hypothetical protein J07HX64_02441 [halophilic archaeon J07HX64]|nr:MAG: hypothetical protein J07HX64_02441 [halophilic archaeon J07HX64]
MAVPLKQLPQRLSDLLTVLPYVLHIELLVGTHSSSCFSGSEQINRSGPGTVGIRGSRLTIVYGCLKRVELWTISSTGRGRRVRVGRRQPDAAVSGRTGSARPFDSVGDIQV